MRLYKYRDLSDKAESPIQRISEILLKRSFWCAKPSTLNDPSEFIWTGDYTPTNATAALLANILVRLKGRSLNEARMTAQNVIADQRLEQFVRPIFEDMMTQCRQELGLLCLGSSFNNEVMWQRYGGDGNGVCIEIDVPDELLNNHFFPVEYPLEKVLHIDQLLLAFTDSAHTRTIYSLALLSKTPFWSNEEEIRFISKQQCVNVHISESVISNLIMGPKVSSEMRREIMAIIETLTYNLPIIEYSSQG